LCKLYKALTPHTRWNVDVDVDVAEIERERERKKRKKEWQVVFNAIQRVTKGKKRNWNLVKSCLKLQKLKYRMSRSHWPAGGAFAAHVANVKEKSSSSTDKRILYVISLTWLWQQNRAKS